MRVIKKVIRVFKDIVENPNRIKHYINRVGEELLSEISKNKVIKYQDLKLKQSYNKNTKKIIVFLVPGWDGVNGGIMSICSIAQVSNGLKYIHNGEVLFATLPKHKLFTKYSGFDCPFNIYRFEQLFDYFTELEGLLLHIPENFVIDFLDKLSSEYSEKIKKINNVQINVMNQNIWLMPEPKIYKKLNQFTENVTITVAHRKYCTKTLRDKYSSSVHLLSTSNLTTYYYRDYKNKENILLTSVDNHPFKKEIIRKIKETFPFLGIIQIENMSYEEYKLWISRAKWMITFGEGIDGYFVESIRSGAISFAVYNSDFFSDTFDGLINVYENYKEMLNNIIDDIKELDNPDNFKSLSDHLMYLDQLEYNDEEYARNIGEFYLGKYTFLHPGANGLEKIRKERLKRYPLVSVVMAVYNGEQYLKEQLESIANLTYKNIELIISDDYSEDSTIQIIEGFRKKFPLKLVMNDGEKGVNGNFENALKYAKGDYIALCDQDDIWYPNKIEILLEHIDDYDIIHSAVDLIDQNGESNKNKILIKEYTQDHTSKTEFIDFITVGWMLGCTSLIRKEIIKKSMPFPKDIFFHDWWMTFVSIKEGNGIKYINIPTIKYRQHSNNSAQKVYSTSSWYNRKIKFNILLESKFIDNLMKNERIALRNNTNYCAAKYFLITDNNGDYKEVDKFLLENKEIFSRHFFNKFVEIVADDIIIQYGLSHNKLNLKGYIYNLLKNKIKNPQSFLDKVISKIYLMILKPLIMTPYRKFIKKSI